MNKRAYLLRMDGTEQDLEPHQRGRLREIYKLIGEGCDTIDTVNLRPPPTYRPTGMVMLVDDTGLLRGLPINPKASQMYWAQCRPGTMNPIVGNVVICPDADFGGTVMNPGQDMGPHELFKQQTARNPKRALRAFFAAHCYDVAAKRCIQHFVGVGGLGDQYRPSVDDIANEAFLMADAMLRAEARFAGERS